MESDAEEIVTQSLESNVTRVEDQLDQYAMADDYQLLDLQNASSCTIQAHVPSDSRFNADLSIDVNYSDENSVEICSTFSQATTSTGLESMISYCFSTVENEQEKYPSTEKNTLPLNDQATTRTGLESTFSYCFGVVRNEQEYSSTEEKTFPLNDFSFREKDELAEEISRASERNIDENQEVEVLDIEESLIDDQVYSSSSDDDTILESISDNDLSDHLSDKSVSVLNSKRKYNSKKITRKRLRVQENWAKNVRKTAVNCNLPYKHLKTNQVVNPRELKRSCGPGCRFQCETKISESRRREIFDNYWKIGDQSGKYNFIARYVSEEKNLNQEKAPKKSFKRKYTLSNTEGCHVAVCKTMFMNTLSISHTLIDTTLRKARDDASVLKDNRGSSSTKASSKKISQEITDSVIEHINMFPRIESHYTRKDSQREYLEETLSLSGMYRLYKEWAEENHKPLSSKHHYFDVFNTQFNISFFKPKKDQCDHCEKFKNATENEKASLEIQHKLHLSNKEKSRAEKANDLLFAKENEQSTSLICFDFQKVLSTPKTDTGCLYYKRKLSVYNFTIFDIVRHKAYCYVWSEDDAKKGSNEVASCLLHYFIYMASTGIDKFLLYSDNCSGQNRNKNVFSMYTYASGKYKIDIKHTFLEVGHTQNEGDNVHAQIERHSRKQKIYNMDEWCEIIKTAKINNPKYDVINVTFDMIYDFKDLVAKQNWNKSVIKNGKVCNSPVGISKFKIIKTSADQPNQLQYKTSFEEDYLTLVTRKDKDNKNVRKYDLTQAYETKQGIPKLKLKDLLDLCKSGVIPTKYRGFYESFQEKLNTEAETEKSGEEEA